MTTSTIAATILQQLGGAGRIAAMTGAQLVAADDSVTLVFPRQVGRRKFTHLTVKLRRDLDLYQIDCHRLNRKTFDLTSCDGCIVGVERLRAWIEQATGLALAL
jgi:hypothetical protein